MKRGIKYILDKQFVSICCVVICFIAFCVTIVLSLSVLENIFSVLTLFSLVFLLIAMIHQYHTKQIFKGIVSSLVIICILVLYFLIYSIMFIDNPEKDNNIQNDEEAFFNNKKSQKTEFFTMNKKTDL